MRIPFVIGLVFWTSFALIVWVEASACGNERWNVKIGVDSDAHKVRLTPRHTTIARLSAFKVPAHLLSREDARFPMELRTFSVSGRLMLIKREKDRDYHLVIGDTAGRTMIVEATDPACAKRSRFLEDIASVRAAIDSFFGGPVTSTGQTLDNVAVNVMGVAFFDPIHGQEGAAPNGIELHPILQISLRRL